MRKRKSGKRLFKKTKGIIKKASENERMKKEEKKKQKRNKPKGYTAKRIGMITFWMLFFFMLLVTFISIFSPSNAETSSSSETRNKLYSQEGIEFARDFIKEYFTWTNDRFSEERREYNLSPYLLSSVRVDDFPFDDKWTSTIDKRDIVLKETQKISDDKARFVFKVNITFEKPTNKKDTKIDYNKISFEEVLEKEQKAIVKNGKLIKHTEKYISVPIVYQSELDRFAVFDLPSFTFIDDNEQINEEIEFSYERLNTVTDTFMENNIVAFLETFFESYTKDDKDKLSYIIEDEKNQVGLAGSMEFSDIESVRIYEVDDNHNRFIVQSTVTLTDPSTKLEFDNKYLVVIKRKDQRYVVESLNDERYVEKLANGILSSEEHDERNDNNEEYESDESNEQVNNTEN